MINQVQKPTAVKQPVNNYLPAQTKIGNKQVTPVTMPKETLDPATGKPTDKAGFGMPGNAQQSGYSTTSAATNQPTATTTNNPAPTGGLLGGITQPVKPASPEFNYQSDGYTGVQGATNKQYDPRSESLVENRLGGLLDPNSALMKRAISQTQEQAASRGLQSSSLAAGAGMGAMIDRALPIAQQDAQTYGNADQVGWQQNFQSEQNNLSRQHDASMFDKNANLQAALSDLQYRQQLGTLDYQGQQQLQQMERSAQLQNQRDTILQKFDMDKMDAGFLQDLEKTRIQYEHNDSMFEKQIDAQSALDYRNSSANAYNNYLEQVAQVYSNPNMTPEQQAAGVAQLQQMFQQQQASLQAIYGFAAPAQPGVGAGPGTGPATGGGGNQYNPPIMQPGTGGGGAVTPNPGTVIPNRPGGGSTNPVISRPSVIER